MTAPNPAAVALGRLRAVRMDPDKFRRLQRNASKAAAKARTAKAKRKARK